MEEKLLIKHDENILAPSAYDFIVQKCWENGIIKTEFMTDSQLAIILDALSEHLNAQNREEK